MKYFLLCNKYKEEIKIKEEFDSYKEAKKIANLLVKLLSIDLNSERCNIIDHLDLYYISDRIKIIDIIVCNEDNMENFI